MTRTTTALPLGPVARSDFAATDGKTAILHGRRGRESSTALSHSGNERDTFGVSTLKCGKKKRDETLNELRVASVDRSASLCHN